MLEYYQEAHIKYSLENHSDHHKQTERVVGSSKKAASLEKVSPLPTIWGHMLLVCLWQDAVTGSLDTSYHEVNQTYLAGK